MHVSFVAAEAVGRAEALGGQLAEVSAWAGALAEDLAVAVESAQSAQATASEQHARLKVCFGRIGTSIQLHSSTRV